MDVKENVFSEEELEQKIEIKQDEIKEFCKKNGAGQINFFAFEALLVRHIAKLACLYIQLFVLVRHNNLDIGQWLDRGLFYLKQTPIARTIKTIYGPVQIYRKYVSYSNYMVRKRLFTLG
jgi:hypothetical protein